MNYGQNNSGDALQEQVVQRQLEQADVETNPSNILIHASAEKTYGGGDGYLEEGIEQVEVA